MKIRQIILVLSIIAALLSCRYGRPLLAFPKPSEVSIDSHGQKCVVKEWYFPCFRTGVHMGCYGIVKTYDKHKHLIEKEKDKNTWLWQCDGPNKDYTKTIDYDTLGRKTKINYSIMRGGWGDSWILDKTVYYSRNKVDSIIHNEPPKGLIRRNAQF